MDNHEELLMRYELAKSSEYQQIKTIVLDYLISLSTSPHLSERTQGALMVFKYVDSWINEYNSALQRRKEEIENGN